MYVVVYSRSDCPLCDEGLEIVLGLASRRGLDVRKVDIDRSDPATYQKHRYRVPVVVLAGDGEERELGFGRLESRKLAQELDRLLRVRRVIVREGTPRKPWVE